MKCRFDTDVTWDGVTGVIPACCVFDTTDWVGDYEEMLYSDIDDVDSGAGTDCKNNVTDSR